MKEYFRYLEEKRKKDPGYRSGRVFSSMCTLPRKEVVKAYLRFLETNALDPRVFPSVGELEEEVVREAGKFFSHEGACGYVTSGGTEGNLMALWVAREVTGRRKVVAPLSAHYSIRKACSLLGLKLVQVGLGRDYRADVEEVEEKTDGKTAALVATAGTASLGVVDPIGEMAEVAVRRGCFLHVDASLGGFMLPFLGRKGWDFGVEGVSSLTADFHKMGGAPIPCGILLFRERKWLGEVEEEVSYLGGKTFTLLGTRPGASVAAAWMALKLMDGREARRCVELAKELARGIGRVEGLSLVVEPELNVVVFRHEKLSCAELEGRLRERGWVVSRSDFPEGIRLVVMPHHRPSHLASFLKDLRICVGEGGGGPRGN
ncbi:MAG: tyrosine decarboxylase MfnA [Hadesarchaea archaeon]|nr:MAG: tyrosine decarboxylase MfnA [Hadesarchaea archaeon]